MTLKTWIDSGNTLPEFMNVNIGEGVNFVDFFASRYLYYEINDSEAYPFIARLNSREAYFAHYVNIMRDVGDISVKGTSTDTRRMENLTAPYARIDMSAPINGYTETATREDSPLNRIEARRVIAERRDIIADMLGVFGVCFNPFLEE